jgi:DDE_Tnp_1-associated
VPADPSSPIPPGLASLRVADPLRPAETPHLLAYLATIPDPRSPAGCRHPLACVLGPAVAAVLAGARSMAAIAGGPPTRPSRCAPRWVPAATP